ncbi:DNA-binding MarR family transcriptional regulator [Streptomyces sp. SAI-127]|nr:DNA-binding MarR family transcriptional regulator [Streptomyces sp. SAI-127]
MAKRGMVRREGCVQGGRRAFVVIAPEGRGAIAEAAPRHVETVRRLFVDLLTPEELEALCRISRRVLEQLEK